MPSQTQIQRPSLMDENPSFIVSQPLHVNILDSQALVPTHHGHTQVPTHHGPVQVPTKGSQALVPTHHGHTQVPTQHGPVQVPTKLPEVLVQTSEVQTRAKVLGEANTARQDTCKKVILEPILPFMSEDMVPDFIAPAKPILKPGTLKEAFFYLGEKQIFIDRSLPANSAFPPTPNDSFPPSHFIDLHFKVSAHQPLNTPNHMGARIPLTHNKLNLVAWRRRLVGYNCPELCQFIEFGFPLGLTEEPTLESTLRNHGSSYQFYPWWDKFLVSEIGDGEKLGVSGPCGSAPFTNTIISPLMTAPKKPDERRPVFDASFGEFSLNNSTPSDTYLGQPVVYTYPKIEDMRRLLVKNGKGCWLWKRDLSRYFLQIPMDPLDYNKVCFIWRGFLFFFVSLMFGLRHSGLQGQRLTDAVSWIHRGTGMEKYDTQYNVVNYSDDLGGIEAEELRATESFNDMGTLLQELGLKESKSKKKSPSQVMTYLGVEFDSIRMEMRVPADKLAEVRADIESWSRKTTAAKQPLQSLLGRLFWVARCVRFSRVFMGRLLALLREMRTLEGNKKIQISLEAKKDIRWWSVYLRAFNGVTAVFNDDPMPLPFQDLLETTAFVCAGDAYPFGGGAWFKDQYWSREFPIWLKDPAVPIHIKEFWVVIVSAKLWASQWSGHLVYLFCDNDAVVDVLNHEKPKNPDMLTMLREFSYLVCMHSFTPVFRKIDTKVNHVADHISRRHDRESADALFKNVGMHPMQNICVQDHQFKLTAPW